MLHSAAQRLTRALPACRGACSPVATLPRRASRPLRRTAVAAAATPAASSRAAFKADVRAGKPLFGLFLDSASPLVAEQLANIEGFDYMLVDVQHAPTDYQLLGAMITAVNAAGKPAMVRVEGPLDRGTIQQSLDLGAAGVMVPTVNTGERQGQSC